MGGIDPASLNFLINDLARLIRSEFERRIAEERLAVTPAEARVLAHVARGGSTRQHLLAERLGVAPMSLTGFLDRLEAAGLVARVPDPDDRRAKRVGTTPAAEPVLETIGRIGAEVRAAARGDIAESDWALFYETARRAAANLSGRGGDAEEDARE